MQFTHDHEQIRDTLKRYIDEHINPHVDEWEEAGIFPAHQVFKAYFPRVSRRICA